METLFHDERYLDYLNDVSYDDYNERERDNDHNALACGLKT